MGRIVELQAIVAAYHRTGSVWKAGKELGISGQSVYERLRAAGHRLNSSKWTAEERREADSLFAAGVPLAEIARRLGRTYAGVATQLSRLETRTPRTRQLTLPRGAGYDKASTRKHLRDLNRYDGPVTRYARSVGLNVDSLVRALQTHYPDEWATYVATHSDLPQKTCPYCQRVFIPTSGKQTYCDRRCADRARIDHSYFGGRRREAIGLAEGICQLCERQVEKGLSVHHILGKENDPDNTMLIALCSGCHKTVTLLASRAFVTNPRAWEALIQLVLLRSQAWAHSEMLAIQTYVDFEWVDDLEAWDIETVEA